MEKTVNTNCEQEQGYLKNSSYNCSNCRRTIDFDESCKVKQILSTWDLTNGEPKHIDIGDALSEIYEFSRRISEDKGAFSSTQFQRGNFDFCSDCADTLTILFNAFKEFNSISKLNFFTFRGRQEEAEGGFNHKDKDQKLITKNGQSTQTEQVSNPYVCLRDCLSDPELLKLQNVRLQKFTTQNGQRSMGRGMRRKTKTIKMENINYSPSPPPRKTSKSRKPTHNISKVSRIKSQLDMEPNLQLDWNEDSMEIKSEPQDTSLDEPQPMDVEYYYLKNLDNIPNDDDSMLEELIQKELTEEDASNLKDPLEIDLNVKEEEEDDRESIYEDTDFNMSNDDLNIQTDSDEPATKKTKKCKSKSQNKILNIAKNIAAKRKLSKEKARKAEEPKIKRNSKGPRYKVIKTQDGSFQCDGCDDTFLNKKNLLVHRRSHFHDYYKCPVCDTNFIDTVTMQIHVLNNHKDFESSRVESFRAEFERKGRHCFVCDHWFLGKLLRDRHQALVHHVRTDKLPYGVKLSSSNVGTVYCIVEGCGQQLFRGKFVKHMRNFHADLIIKINPTEAGPKEKIDCPKCPRMIFIHQYREHVWNFHQTSTFNTKGAYACIQPDCDRIFRTSGNLQRHMHSVHNLGGKKEGFLCKYCGKSFKIAHYLKQHEIGVHNQSIWICSICPNKYKTRQTLRQHLKIDHKIKNPQISSQQQEDVN